MTPRALAKRGRVISVVVIVIASTNTTPTATAVAVAVMITVRNLRVCRYLCADISCFL